MPLIDQLKEHPELIASINKCKKECKPILQRYISNFPDFTDHSITHSEIVLNLASNILNHNIEILNSDEIYILIMACYLHDIGMAPTKETIEILEKSPDYKTYKKEKDKDVKEYIRETHHRLSYQFIIDNWKNLGIINEIYAKAIALVALGHRKEELIDFEKFSHRYIVRSGSDFVCIPFLASVLRLADELDITNDRTPELLFNKYLPENKISKEEWEKHKANYFVNFEMGCILITAKCDNPFVYNSLLKQYKKIDNALKYTHKVIRFLPQGERILKIDYHKLKDDIKTKGFIPKNIGFSFDLQNTLNTFIGKNLYSDKYVAIREALQNSIDTCKYKKSLDSAFNPKIKVVLSENKLIIEDNGFGMDEFILENFFGKLAKSFYKQKKVTDRYESISEFGIGIFSYFLMCDFFEVETKMESKEALKLRVTKDAESSFFFYDNFNKDEAGTKITLFLNEKTNFESLKNKIKHYFRFIDIPILLEFKDRKEEILSQEFKIEEEDLNKRINLIHKAKINELCIISKKLDTEDYEGILSIIIGKEKNGKVFPIKLYDIIKKRLYGIDICQQGVYINSQDSNVLSYLIGKINIKKKKTLNLSRTGVKEFNLQKVISNFEVKIIDELFSAWQDLSMENKVSITRNFIHRYVSSYTLFPEKISKVFVKNFVVKYYDKEKTDCISLKDFLKEQFMIVNDNSPYTRGNYYDFSDVNTIYQKFKIPILMCRRDVDDEVYLNLFKSLEFNIIIDSNNKNWFYVIEPKIKSLIKKQILGDRRTYGLNFKNKEIVAFPHVGLDRPLNLNHPIVQHLIKNEEKIIGNQDLYDLMNQFIELIHDLAFHFHIGGIKNPNEFIKNMNEILGHLNKNQNTDFKLSADDFSFWIQKEL